MLYLEVVIAAAVLVGVALVASRDVAGLEDADHDTGDIGLPTGRLLRSDDVDRLRFRTVGGVRGIRGYRFADVDATMEKVREALLDHEQRTAGATQPGRGGPAER